SKALSEPFARLRYLDTSLLVWRQQQAAVPQQPSSYLSRSQSAWYSSYGNSAVVVPDKSRLDDEQGRSRICALM
uniref:Si:ch1073-363c19.3 n=1 Tax=Hippocampus comes TaxID=109280 RepID=A0A3Q2XJF4_HIPCM